MMDSPLGFHQRPGSSQVFSQPRSEGCEGAACDSAAVERAAPERRQWVQRCNAVGLGGSPDVKSFVCVCVWVCECVRTELSL